MDLFTQLLQFWGRFIQTEAHRLGQGQQPCGPDTTQKIFQQRHKVLPRTSFSRRFPLTLKPNSHNPEEHAKTGKMAFLNLRPGSAIHPELRRNKNTCHIAEVNISLTRNNFLLTQTY